MVTMAGSESVIRRMTRLAMQHGAVNLSQGFTDEAPAYPLVWGAIAAALGGTDAGIRRLERTTVADVGPGHVSLRDALASLQNRSDTLNQYSFPFGLPELRHAIAAYTERWSAFHPDPDDEITVVLGATEGLAAVLGAVGTPGDAVVVVEPFHEMYPAQAGVFSLQPRFVTLRERSDRTAWTLDGDELRRAAAGARLLVLNTPHNPTGTVFSFDEMNLIADVARAHDLVVVTDEIYEHLVFDGARHRSLASFDGMRDRTVVVNSISKMANATGWRVGWVLSPRALTPRIRALHDTLVIQAPTPLQKAAVTLLELDDTFFERIREGYAAKRAVMQRALEAVGFRLTTPRGAYYLFADYREVPALRDRDPMAAALCLIEGVGVAAVPGDNFYAVSGDGARYLRFTFCRSIATLEDAARRLSRLGD